MADSYPASQMRPLLAGLRVNMIELTAAKIKAAQSETGLGSGKFRFKSCYGSNTGKWALSRCLKQGIESPNAHRARLVP